MSRDLDGACPSHDWIKYLFQEGKDNLGDSEEVLSTGEKLT